MSDLDGLIGLMTREIGYLQDRIESDAAKIERLTNRGIEDMKDEIETQKAEIARLSAVVERLGSGEEFCDSDRYKSSLTWCIAEVSAMQQYARDNLTGDT